MKLVASFKVEVCGESGVSTSWPEARGAGIRGSQLARPASLPHQIFPSHQHPHQSSPCTKMDNLTPQDLFSPSKARQQRAQAADWAQIDSWLSYKYAGRTVPTFERNEETLKVLRELSTANERADEERIILERVEREACKELEEDEV